MRLGIADKAVALGGVGKSSFYVGSLNEDSLGEVRGLRDED